MRTVAIVNQKGGSGKTTSAINLAAALARMGQRTLLVDMDPQGHCALGMAVPEQKIDLHVGDALLTPDDRRLDESRLLWSIRDGLDLMPATTKLAGLEASRGGLAERSDRDQRLTALLARFSGAYDWAVVDCSPAIGLLTFNAIRAAQEVIVPVELGFFALTGASKQVATLEALGRRFGSAPRHHVVPTMHDPDSPLSHDVLDQLTKRFRDAVLPVTVRFDLAVKEAASLGVPVIDYAPKSRASLDYAALAEWVSVKLRGPKPQSSPAQPRTVADADPPRLPFEHASAGASANSSAGAVAVELKPGPDQAAADEVGSDDAADRFEHAGSSAVTSPTLSRAAELAARARRLAERTARSQARRDADPRVASIVSEINAANQDAARAENQPDSPHAAASMVSADLARLFGAHQTSRGVLFVQPGTPDRPVFIAGDHNDWSSSATPMRFNARLGVYEAILNLPPGPFRYRLVVGDAWTVDPYNPLQVPNPFGQRDSIVEVKPNAAGSRAQPDAQREPSPNAGPGAGPETGPSPRPADRASAVDPRTLR